MEMVVVSHTPFSSRDPKHKSFYYAKSFDKSKRPKSGTKLASIEQEDSEPPEFKKITPRGANRASEVQDIIQGVVGNFVGITRAVRQHLLPEKQLLEVKLEGGDVMMSCDAIVPIIDS